LKSAALKAGLTRYKPHALRHSVASNLVRSGCDLFRVAQLLGHRNPNMVIQVYGHLRPDDHHQAAAMMEALLTRHQTAI
jgi:integrase